jgi:hypothetical protein
LTLPALTCRRLCGIKKQAIFDDLSVPQSMKNFTAVVVDFEWQGGQEETVATGCFMAINIAE